MAWSESTEQGVRSVARSLMSTVQRRRKAEPVKTIISIVRRRRPGRWLDARHEKSGYIWTTFVDDED